MGGDWRATCACRGAREADGRVMLPRKPLVQKVAGAGSPRAATVCHCTVVGSGERARGRGGAAGATAVRNFGEPVPCGRYLSQWRYIGIMIRQNRDGATGRVFDARDAVTSKIKFLSCVERVQLVTRRVRAPITRGARSAPSDSVPTHPSHRDTSRPRDALTATTRRAHRDHSTAHALSCSNRTRCHSVTRGGGQRQSETRRIRGARRHTRPWPRCRQHMHTTHAHQTDSPRSGERNTTSPNRCPASRRACATCNLDTK